MIDLNDDMRQALETALADGLPVIVATSGAAGMPDLAYKGSVLVWDKDHLAWWERAHGTTLKNLQENPQVSLLYRNPAKRQAWKYFGAVELLSDGPVREGIMARTPQAELDRDPDRKGIAVLIRVDRVMQAGQLFQEREG